MVALPRNAIYVDTRTIGFTIGAASIKATAINGGTPLSIRRLTIGTTPHSQVGIRKPPRMPAISPPGTLFGNQRNKRSVETKTSIRAENSEAITRNGIASMKMAVAMLAKVPNIQANLYSLQRLMELVAY
jgi:hypothetical protein